ncbi:WD40/YVTN/BNR-like repeat-containing protein [Derxia gummosa]|uniref:WD40/YVTN/BNR-like repeat-containing protein n=1 Tax=Derxia gummosa DSM 723 TaxID=1121388 RepID=A0A8B6X473_9BURK|nr:YCF48-related protein [Derxia gummosa]
MSALPVAVTTAARRLPAAVMTALALLAGGAVAAPVGDALDRPAIAVRAPEHANLLAVAQAGDRLVAVGERGIVALSDDGGAHWRQASVPVSVSLTAVRFADATTGYAVGHGGVVLATDDGGQTWTRRLDGLRIARIAHNAALAAGDARAEADAARLVADGPDKPLLDLLLAGRDRLVVVGAYGLALASDDGGRSWRWIAAGMPNPKGLHLYAIRARGDTLLVAGEQGLVLRSDDGGHVWRRLALPYDGSFFTAELPSDRELVVAGLRGNVWRSANGGASWTKLDLPVPASITASALDARGGLLLASQAGLVLRASGDAVAPVDPRPLGPLAALLARADGSVLTLGLAGPVSLPAAGQGAPR